MDALISYIQDLSLKFVNFHYQKYLNENGISTIPKNSLETVVDSMYSDRITELKEFLRISLKEIFQQNYNSLVVENVLSELDKDCSKNKIYIINEINHYQSTLDS